MSSSSSVPTRSRARLLIQFFWVTYTVTLLNAYGFLRHADVRGIAAALYTLAVFLTYSAVYLLPAILIVVIAHRLFRPGTNPGNGRTLPSTARRDAVVYVIAVLTTGATQVVVFADRTVFTIFGMHLNGFVWNTVFTSGGLASMGESSAATFVYAAYIVGYFIVQTLLLLLVLRVSYIDWVWRRWNHGARRWVAPMVLILCAAGQALGYGISDIRSYSPILVSASAFPLYLPVTFRHLAHDLGFEVRSRREFSGAVASGQLNYPLAPIELSPPARPMNLVWLVSESLRADMLDPEIMPATSKFGERAHRFNRHYSGGNGTRMGLFSMFYGLYGNLWFTFLREHHGPVLMDVLLKQDYRMELFTSAHFSYPEFDRTVFAKVPSDHLHEENRGQGWERDRKNVGDIIAFLQEQTPDQAFMTFVFFESPHARYYFPPESVIRTPYLEDFNYATMDLDRDMPLIKNRYINSCHHLDGQIARLLEELERLELLDSTIVLITGDHGEAFMEKGRWGHNSDFTEEQVRVPMVLWVPGTGASVTDRLTSHLDIVPTLMPLLGVVNPPRDFTFGKSLLGEEENDYIVLADWNRIAYLDGQFKAAFPIQVGGVLRTEVTTADDQPIDDPDEFFRTRQVRLLNIMKDMGRFTR